MATTININDLLTLIDYNNLENAGNMTYAVSDTQCGSISGTYNTFCIHDNVYIWRSESFPVKDISSSVGQIESPSPVGAGPLDGEVDYIIFSV
jgi:hypothetical protein